MTKDLHTLLTRHKYSVQMHMLEEPMKKWLMQCGIYHPNGVKALRGVTVSIKSGNVKYEGLGFTNVNNGVEFYIAGMDKPLTYGRRGVTRILYAHNQGYGCYVFNDIIDYIVFVTAVPFMPFSFEEDYDFLILNNPGNYIYLAPLLDFYTYVGTFMPNNTYGCTLTQTLRSRCKERLIDYSFFYRGYEHFRDLAYKVTDVSFPRAELYKDL